MSPACKKPVCRSDRNCACATDVMAFHGGTIRADSHPELLALSQSLSKIVTKSVASSTLSRYDPAWDGFKAWCLSMGRSYLPAEPFTVALYLTKLSESAAPYNSLKVASASIFKVHELCNMKSPTESPVVQAVREAGARSLDRGVNKKEPFSWDHIESLAAQKITACCSLPDLVTVTAMSVAFCGFFRYSDLVHIFVDEIVFREGHMEVFLESRKNDQYREGHRIVISALGKSRACPVALTRSLIARAGLSGHRPLFSAVTQTGSYKSEAISYTALSNYVLKAIEGLGLDKAKYGLHSLRSGGATLAANSGVQDSLWMEHGGWKSERAARGYIKTSVASKLSVNHSMFPQYRTQPSGGTGGA